MTRHLTTCPQEHDEATKPSSLFRLRVEDAYTPFYWLDIEVKATAELSDLDRFLRDIWLECCGHLSLFAIGNTQYHSNDELVEDDEDDFADIFPSLNQEALELLSKNRIITKGMNISLAKVLEPGLKFTHEYDFGSTTELKLKVVSEREGHIKQELRLLSRNIAPTWTCNDCGENATLLNLDEWDSDNPFYCDEHSDDEEYMYLPVVNSPRMGVCGYTG